MNVMNLNDKLTSFGMTVTIPESKIVEILDASDHEMQPVQTEVIIEQRNLLFLPLKLVEAAFTGNKIVKIQQTAFSELTNLKKKHLLLDNGVD